MSRITVSPAPAALTLVATAEPPELPPEVQARIETIWAAERARRGARLFNGPLFSVATITPDRIEGTIVRYPWFVAQRRDPTLAAVLRVRPLAVGGVLSCADGIIFGRRGGDVEQDAGLWEPVPSGGIDGTWRHADGSLDAAAQLLAELAEEVGLGAGDLTGPPEPSAIIADASTGVTILGFFLRTDLSEASVIARFAALAEREYGGLMAVARVAVRGFLADRAGAINPASVALVEAALPLLAADRRSER